MQFGKLADSVYPKLEEYGIKQIAQRTAGFDMYDLDLAKNMALSFQMYLVIHQKLLLNIQFLSLLQLVRRFPRLKTCSRT